MVKNDQQIKSLNIINPYDEDLLQSHSYDCTLGNLLLIQENERGLWGEIKLSNHIQYCLMPGEFILGATEQSFNMPSDIIGFVQGKSSRGREGIQIECAGLIDPLFSGQLTLEIFNMSKWPFSLSQGMAIAQVWFASTNAATIKPYNKFGHYNGQQGPTISRLG